MRLRVCFLLFTVSVWSSADAQLVARPGWPVTAPFVHLDQLAAPVVEDLDGDGCDEVIVVGRSGSGLHVFHGDGTPRSGFPYTGLGITGSQGPVVGDITGDGHKEILIGKSGAVFAFRGNGLLVPGWPVVSGDSSLVSNFALYDYVPGNGLELLVGFSDSDEINIEVFDGAGGLLPQSIHDFSVVPWLNLQGSLNGVRGMAVGDLDRDGHAEIVVCGGVTNFSGLPDPGMVFVFDQGGSVWPGWPVLITDTDLRIRHPALVDLDGNGQLEVVANDTNLYVWNNNGTPHWTHSRHVGTLASPPSCGDVNGDGLYEIVTAGSNVLRVYNRSGISQIPSPTILPNPLREGLLLADLTGDGVQEIVGRARNEIYVFDSTGAPLLGTPYVLPDLGDTPVSGLATGDLDGDGKLELVVVYMAQLHVFDVVGPVPTEPAVSAWSGLRNSPWSCNHAEQRLFKQFRPGDLNETGALELGDIVRLARVLAGVELAPCAAAGDVDGDSRLRIQDLLVAISYLFISGPPPALPFPQCGYRATSLSCETAGCL